MIMHLLAHGEGSRWNGIDGEGLEQPDELVDPETRPSYFHYYSDASNGLKSITGGISFLARGPINVVCGRQHLTAPDAHSSECVGGGTNLNALVPANGILQEIHIRLGKPTPMYFDSSSTVDVARSDKSAKRSLWLQRRVLVMQEAIEHDEMTAERTSDALMHADALTKYLPYAKWRRHMDVILNVK